MYIASFNSILFEFKMVSRFVYSHSTKTSINILIKNPDAILWFVFCISLKLINNKKYLIFLLLCYFLTTFSLITNLILNILIILMIVFVCYPPCDLHNFISVVMSYCIYFNLTFCVSRIYFSIIFDNRVLSSPLVIFVIY